MTEATEVTGIVDVLTPVVMAFPAVTEPRKIKIRGKESGEAKYGASFVFPIDHPDLAKIKERIMGLAKAKWPGRDIAADVKAGNFKLPISPGNSLIAKQTAKLVAQGKTYEGKSDFMKDKIVLKASSKYPPRLAVISGGKISPDLEGAAIAANKSKFFFGAEVLLQVNLQAYDRINAEAKDGVTAYLNIVMATGGGKRLGGGVSASEAFAAYKGTSTNEDPTQGLDDEIPF
jgi:Protein of unknown function (DUF2815)